MRALSPREISVAWWALRASRAVRTQLAAGHDVHTPAVRAPAPPALRAHLSYEQAHRVLDAVLLRRGAACLERSVIEQRLALAWGLERDVVLGVRGGSRAFEAHAWLEGDDDAGYEELSRRPAAVAAIKP